MYTKKGLAIAFSLVLISVLVVGAIALIPQYEAGAWSCGKYNFRVLEDGTVQVQNKSNSAEPSQSANVYINGVLTDNSPLSVLAMPAHTDWTTIGHITPPTGSWSWQVVGTSDCSNSGEFEVDYQLNLSHIECVDEGENGYLVEVHFVLLNVPDGLTPGTLSYTYGTIEPGAHTGNVWHYTDWLPDGYYNITSASVEVNGVTVNLHNPGDYSGEYDCSDEKTTSVEVGVGSCRWDGEESLTPVTLIINEGSKITLNGVEYLSSTTIYLPPGHYTWSATALEGYVLTGKTSGEFDTFSCKPGEAYVDLNTSVCEEVQITIVGELKLTILLADEDLVITQSETLDLPPGKYHWRAVAAEGYEIIGEDEGFFVVDSCESPKRPECPTCGPPVWESSNGGMAFVWFSDTPCRICWSDGVWKIKLHTRVRIWSEVAFVLEYPVNVFHEPDMVNGDDGITYYVLDINDHTANNSIIWGPNGKGDRYRDHAAVNKYSACSVAPGYYDAPNGVAIWKPGHTVMDWVKFLLTNGYFANEEHPGNLAIGWANKLRLEGTLALPAR